MHRAAALVLASLLATAGARADDDVAGACTRLRVEPGAVRLEPPPAGAAAIASVRDGRASLLTELEPGAWRWDGAAADTTFLVVLPRHAATLAAATSADARACPADDVEVVATDAAGRGLPGARLVLRHPLTGQADLAGVACDRDTTDAAGRARCARLEGAVVTAEAAGVEASAPAEGDRATLVLAGVTYLRARLVDERGAPRAGVEVDARLGRAPGAARLRALADGEGTLVLHVPDRPLDAVVVASRGLRTIERPTSPGEHELGDLVLAQAATVRGRLRGPGERTPRRARFEVVAEDGSITDRELTLDADGSFELPGLAAGVSRLRVEVSGLARPVLDGLLLEAGGVTDVGTIELRSEARLHGVVVDAAGSPVEGAEVTLSAAASDLGRIRPVVTSADGTFAFDDLDPLERRACASHPERVTACTQAVPAGEPEPLRLVLEEGAAVEGLVAEAEGEPAPGRTVRVLRRLVERSAITDPAGRYVMEGLAPGAVTIECEGQRREITLAAGGRATADFTVGAGTVSGSFTLAGAPAKGVATLEGLEARFRRHSLAGTAGADAFAFEAVPPGPYLLSGLIDRPDGGSVACVPRLLRVVEDRPSGLVLEADPFALEVRVLACGGPAEVAFELVPPELGDPSWRVGVAAARTAAECGRGVRVELPAAGTYRVRVVTATAAGETLRALAPSTGALALDVRELAPVPGPAPPSTEAP